MIEASSSSGPPPLCLMSHPKGRVNAQVGLIARPVNVFRRGTARCAPAKPLKNLGATNRAPRFAPACLGPRVAHCIPCARRELLCRGSTDDSMQIRSLAVHSSAPAPRNQAESGPSSIPNWNIAHPLGRIPGTPRLPRSRSGHRTRSRINKRPSRRKQASDTLKRGG